MDGDGEVRCVGIVHTASPSLPIQPTCIRRKDKHWNGWGRCDRSAWTAALRMTSRRDQVDIKLLAFDIVDDNRSSSRNDMRPSRSTLSSRPKRTTVCGTSHASTTQAPMHASSADEAGETSNQCGEALAYDRPHCGSGDGTSITRQAKR